MLLVHIQIQLQLISGLQPGQMDKLHLSVGTTGNFEPVKDIKWHLDLGWFKVEFFKVLQTQVLNVQCNITSKQRQMVKMINLVEQNLI